MFLPVEDRTPFYAGAGLGTFRPTKDRDVLNMTVLVMYRAANITIGVVTPCTIRPQRTYGVWVLEMTIVCMQLPLHLSTTPVCMTWVTRGMHRTLTVVTTLNTDRLRTEMNMVVRVTFGMDTNMLTMCTTTLETYAWVMVVTVLTSVFSIKVNRTDSRLTMSEHCVLQNMWATMLCLMPLALNRRLVAGDRQSMATVRGLLGETIGVVMVMMISSVTNSNVSSDLTATPSKWPNPILGCDIVLMIPGPLNSTLYCFDLWADKYA